MHQSPSPGVLDRLVAVARAWRVILPFAIVTPLVVFVLTAAKPPSYVSSASVLLDRRGMVISDLRDPTFWYPGRNIRTQARLARLPDVARRAVAAADLEELGGFWLLDRSAVIADGDTDVMTFEVRDEDPERAAWLATIYAEQYIAYRHELDGRALNRAIRVLERQLEQSRARGSDPSSYAELVRKVQQLHTALATLQSNATVVRPAGEATRAAPSATQAALVAGVLGLVVGVGLVVLAGLLDPGARSASEIADQLRLPILGKLPLEHRTKRPPSELAILTGGDDPRAEAIRALRRNLELDADVRPSGVVMITSSVAGEGKSTTAVNLAYALAFAGRRVVLVDMDLRRPVLATLFDLPETPGTAEVLLRSSKLDDVAHVVQLRGQDGGNAAYEANTAGTLRVVTAGGRRARDQTELAAGPVLTRLFESLGKDADVVLVDCPPLLLAGDALTLTRYADGLLFVANTKMYRNRYASELRRALAASPARPLGLVVVGDPGELEPAHAYAYRVRREVDRDAHVLGRA